MATQKYAVYVQTRKGSEFVGWYDTLNQAKEVKQNIMELENLGYNDTFIQLEDPNLYEH